MIWQLSALAPESDYKLELGSINIKHESAWLLYLNSIGTLIQRLVSSGNYEFYYFNLASNRRENKAEEQKGRNPRAIWPKNEAYWSY